MNKKHTLMNYKPGGQQADLFEKKLQDQTGWSRTFCKKAIVEYTRFVYLASISDTPVTPSIIVDEVWHLHLTFSRCYWEEMCGEVLGHPLHHDPAAPSEQSGMNDQYLLTISLYEQSFGEAPPQDIWPVKTSETSGRFQKWAPITFIAITSLFVGATAIASEVHTTDKANIGFWILTGLLGVIVLNVLLRSTGSKRYTHRINKRRRNGHCSGSGAGGGGCSTFGSDCSSGGGASCGGGGCGGS